MYIVGLPDSVTAISNNKGQFSIAKSDKLVFSKLGYQSRIINLDKDNNFIRAQVHSTSTTLDEVVITDFTVQESLLETTANREMINRSQIERNTPDLIVGTLNELPGVYMQSGAYNTNRITIRGIGSRSPFSTNKIRAYYGEIPLTNGTGETTIEDIDLSHINSMEIIKGPNSSIYGSGLGGVMLISPEEPDAVNSSRSVEISLGSFGFLKTNANLSMTGQNKGLKVAIGRQSADGYRENNDFERTNIFLHTDLFSEKNRFTFLGYLIDQQASIPSSIGITKYRQNPTAAAGNWAAAQGYEDYTTLRLGFEWDRILNSDWVLKTSIFGNYRNNYEPRPFNILSEDELAGGLRARLIGNINDRNVLMFGTEVFRDLRDWKTFENLYQDFPDQGSVEGSTLTRFDELRGYSNIFANWNFDINDKIRLRSGFNLNITGYHIDDLLPGDNDQSGAYTFDPILSPRFGINYRILETVSAFASVSHGFSTPTLEETLTPDGLINESIEPETGWMEEIGIRGQWNRFSLSSSVYLMQIENLLVARRTAEDQFIGLNAGSTRQNGLEIAARYDLLNSDNTLWRFESSYSYQDYKFLSFVDNENDFSGNELTGVPGQQFFGSTYIDLFGAYAEVNLTWIDEIPITDANDVYAPAYHLLDISGGYSIQIQNWNVDFRGWVRNVLNTDYASMVQVNASAFGSNEPRYYYPGLPRNFMARIKLSYYIN